MTANLLSVEALERTFLLPGRGFFAEKRKVRAVDDVSFDIRRGEVFGLVGESGCGKTTTGRMLVRLLSASGGRILFDGQDIATLDDEDLGAFRRRIQMIFQDPYSSLNPRMSVRDIVEEPLRVAGGINAPRRREMVDEALRLVGLSPQHARRHPHEFSGGQRQRIGIARAIVMRPEFIVCDEPVSALDVSTQAQVVNLLQDLQRDLQLTLLFISHDLGVVRQLCDRIGVMYLGRLVEVGDHKSLFEHPLHPYTQALLDAVPRPDPDPDRVRVKLAGDLPSNMASPSGCRFHTRCPYARELCREQVPELKPAGTGRQVACHFVISSEDTKSARFSLPEEEERKGNG